MQSSPDTSLPPPPVPLGRTSGPWAQAGTTLGQGRLDPAGSCSREPRGLRGTSPSGPRFLGSVSALDPPSAPLFPLLSSEGPGTAWSTRLPGFL